ncbi:hypothetical protein NDU88_005119 [Pleurodeles waltl]|uniref:Uncharacterized protein n=1 Tax=Pleurodeles waltl TaxID=8319 RepID=A0AAV7MB70_PLEWA|nr:hypothetical protein NDU88_005119 [Pleurodeles waltl]
MLYVEKTVLQKFAVIMESVFVANVYANKWRIRTKFTLESSVNVTTLTVKDQTACFVEEMEFANVEYAGATLTSLVVPVTVHRIQLIVLQQMDKFVMAMVPVNVDIVDAQIQNSEEPPANCNRHVLAYMLNT